MKTTTTRLDFRAAIFFFFAALFLVASDARAQVVNDGATNTLNNVTNSFVGTVTVGTNGSFTALILTNSVLLTNTLDGVIGFNTGANSNSVFLQGPNTRWLMGRDLYVGSNGAFNRLVISNNAVVGNDDGDGRVGWTSGASNNQVVVTGNGSTWSNHTELNVGNSGSFNTLLITNGARVVNTGAKIGFFLSAKNNQVTVTGPTSVWSNMSALYVSYYGSGNTLLVTNGGRATSTGAYIGYDNLGTSNQVIVTGPNSVWTNGIDLYVGFFGSFNTLLVSNGGRIDVESQVLVGGDAAAKNNSLLSVNGTLTSKGLLLSYGFPVGGSSRNNSVTLLSNSTWNVGGDNFLWGGLGSNDALVIDTTSSLTNIGALFLERGNTVFFLTNAPGGYSLNGFTTQQLGFRAGALESVDVGYMGVNVQLIISNYTLADTNGGIGSQSTARSNSVLVAGANSVWTNSQDMRIGNSGSFNTLWIADAGVVANRIGYIGTVSGASNDQVIVTGSNSLWNNRSNLYVGYNGSFNTLLITNGGMVKAANAYIGYNASASNNALRLANGTLTVSGSLTIGSNNTLAGTGTVNGSVTNCGTIFLTNADLMTFTGPVVNKGVVLALTGTPRFNAAFVNTGTLITTASINVANLSVSGADVVLGFNTVSNYVHEVQASADVSTGVWQSLTNGLLGTGSLMTFTDVGGASNSTRTYRVRLFP